MSKKINCEDCNIKNNDLPYICYKCKQIYNTITKIKRHKCKLYYAVANGRETGVFDNWDECYKSVNKYSNNKFKKFNSFDDANKYVEQYKRIFNNDDDIIEKIYLYITCNEKDNAKKYGAKWDYDNKCWYTLSNNDYLINKYGVKWVCDNNCCIH